MTVGKNTCASGVGCCCPHLGTGFKCALFGKALSTAGSPKGWVKRCAECKAAGTPVGTTASDEEIVAAWRKGLTVDVLNMNGTVFHTTGLAFKSAPTEGVLRQVRGYEEVAAGTIRVAGTKSKAVK